MESHTADGKPSLSFSSTCHCWHKVAGARISAGPSPAESHHGGGCQSDSVLPTPTSSASTTGPRRSSRGVEEQADEGPLPGLQLFALAVERRFHQGAGRDIGGLEVLQFDFDFAGEPPDFLDDGVGQWDAAIPQIAGILPPPRRRLPGEPVLPDDLVVFLPTFAGLVQAADKGGL